MSRGNVQRSAIQAASPAASSLRGRGGSGCRVKEARGTAVRCIGLTDLLSTLTKATFSIFPVLIRSDEPTNSDDVTCRNMSILISLNIFRQPCYLLSKFD